MLDVVNDLKSEPHWQLNESQKAGCDAIVKKMVFSRNDDASFVYELVRSLFDLLRSIAKGGQLPPSQVQSHPQLPSSNDTYQKGRAEDADGTRRICKNIEIVLDVFKRAADKVGKVGEREWRQVFDQQRYVLEEVLNTTKDKKKQSKGLDEALADFNFLLKKAVENLVQSDRKPITQDASDVIAFKEAHQKMVAGLPKSVQDLLTRVTQRQMTTSSLVYEAKAYGSRVVKDLRDELSNIQQKHVKETNATILDFEMEGRQQRDLNALRREELLTEFKRVTQ